MTDINDDTLLTRGQLAGLCAAGLFVLCMAATSIPYGPVPPSHFLLIPAFIIGPMAAAFPALLYLVFTELSFRFRISRKSSGLPVPLPSWFLVIFVAGFSGYYHFVGPLSRGSGYVSDAMVMWWHIAYVLLAALIVAILGLATLKLRHREKLTTIANAVIVFWWFTYAFGYAGEMP